MGSADRRTAESHLRQAAEHFATARNIVVQLHDQAELSATERRRLNEIAASVGALAEQLTDTIGGTDLMTELASYLSEEGRGRP